MARRMVSIWFRHLVTDYKIRRDPGLKTRPFAMAMQERNRRVIKAVNSIAQAGGIYSGMVVTDAKALVPGLLVLDYNPEQPKQLLASLAEWCIRYTPSVSLDMPGGLFLDASGCTHLWGGEVQYLEDLVKRLNAFGYSVSVAMADTASAAWAVCRFTKGEVNLVPPGQEAMALSTLPPAALRLDETITERLEKLGLNTVASFMSMPSTALRRRFGQNLLTRLGQALGTEMEMLEPVKPPAPYQERLPCLEPICTATGIEIAIKTLLETICERLARESKGLRKCELCCYRLDGNIQQIAIGTNSPSRHAAHLFKLFENHITQIEPDLGIELFVMEAGVVEELLASQDALWDMNHAGEKAVAELQDRLSGKVGPDDIQWFVAEECHWPERSIKSNANLVKQPAVEWRSDLPRPSHLLLTPEPIEVSVLLPDYPPLLFIHKGTRYDIKKADGPERIEQEWWKQEGLYRDYYCVEDERGERYWLFRLGDYKQTSPKWFIHGFFA